MPRIINSPEEFTIIGENIHATRVVLRNGRRAITLDSGIEAIPFEDEQGKQQYLTVPDSYKETQPYKQGQIKHCMVAMTKGIGDNEAEREEGAAYIHHEARRQATAGSHFLDLNVDELSYNIEIQKRAMGWLVKTVQEVSSLPLSIDSSSPDIIASGLSAYDARSGRPMINSVALERLETLDLVKQYNAKVVVTAAGVDSMPQNDKERIANVTAIMDAVHAAKISMSDVYIDCIVFPISVSGDYGPHYLTAVAAIRETYGPDVHITGGLSNVSFGLPKRKLINDTFIHLAIEAGIDAGIIDPIQSNLGQVLNLDLESESVSLAHNMLMGGDEFCAIYIKAFRDGRL